MTCSSVDGLGRPTGVATAGWPAVPLVGAVPLVAGAAWALAGVDGEAVDGEAVDDAVSASVGMASTAATAVAVNNN
ncbi:hypothetical protein [Frankia sp. Cr2]|uniref:hypothetical protein n=1 Tax=Frankia sp. Cr2 TaxID=3073932 RepID=UPI002AD4E021|nr:hypothetical protein [Frankia sp. Cr2]